jgi:hypothetical protein
MPIVLGAGNPTDQAHCGEGLVFQGDLLVASCSGEDSSARGIDGDVSGPVLQDSGAAYVFTRNQGTWNQFVQIKAELPGANDFYGSSLGLSGETLYVGARGEASNARGVNGDANNDKAPNSGAVYVVR